MIPYNYGVTGLRFGLYITGIILAFIGLWLVYAMIRWKLFVKAGEQGWKSLVPFYGTYTEFKLVWSVKWYWLYLGASLLFYPVLAIPLFGPVLFVAGLLMLMFLTTFKALQESKAFGQSTGFAVGLATLPIVFQFILAFGDATYVGPQEDPAYLNELRHNFDSPDKLEKSTASQPTIKQSQSTNENGLAVVEEATEDDSTSALEALFAGVQQDAMNLDEDNEAITVIEPEK